MAAVVYRGAALADGRSAELRLGVSVLVEDGRIGWIRPSGDEGEAPAGAAVVDASGCTIVPGLVDGHSHLTLPGGAHWVDRIADPTESLLTVAEDNGELLWRSGVRWARDVGSPRRSVDDRERAVAIAVRERWRGRRDRPYVRAAGTWIMVPGLLPPGLAVEAHDADDLLSAAIGQLDDGADLVKLYLDGPDPETAPWTAGEVSRVVAAAHARGAKVTAHSSRLSGSRVCAEAGVDSIEHGFELDADVARTMAERGVGLVTTMTVMKSWLTFGTTTTIPRFAEADNRTRIRDRLGSPVLVVGRAGGGCGVEPHRVARSDQMGKVDHLGPVLSLRDLDAVDGAAVRADLGEQRVEVHRAGDPGPRREACRGVPQLEARAEVGELVDGARVG